MSRFVAAAFRFAAALGVGRWDRFTSWGPKVKDEAESLFDSENLGQMIENFAKRKNDLAMCYDHQSAYVQENGQPAPALAWYNALALVVDGKVEKFATHDETVQPLDATGLENGIYGYRSELTPLGEKLLPNYKFISPLFTDEGADEQGNPIGYDLLDVAATNTPFQDGVGLTFHKNTRAPSAFDKPSGGPMDPEMKKSLGLGDEASDKECMAALTARLKKYEDAEKKMAEDAEAAKMSADADAAKMADDSVDAEKMDDGDGDEDDKKAMTALCKELGLPEGSSAKVVHAAFAAKTAPISEVAQLKNEIATMKAEREAEKAATEKSKIEQFADDAIAGGRWDKTKREQLITFAKASYEAAEQSLLPKGTFTVMGRVTRGGAPIGKTANEPLATDGVNEQEIGAELAKKARAYAKEHNVSLQKAYMALGPTDKTYGQSLNALNKLFD